MVTSELIHKMQSLFWSSSRYSPGDNRRMELALVAVVEALHAEGHHAAADFLDAGLIEERPTPSPNGLLPGQQAIRTKLGVD